MSRTLEGAMSVSGDQTRGTVVDVRAVYKTYDREGAPVRALRGTTLTLGEGEFLAVMGPSGCGKSTLLNMIAGLDTPDEGEIYLAGQSIVGQDENALARLRRRHVGIVFQFFNLLDDMSVLENVALPAMLGGLSRRQAETRGRELLDVLRLGANARDAPGVLSGGQRQRLAIARALANRPTVLLADEPTGALDSAGGAEIVELFRRLHGDRQSILLVTHDPAVAVHADRIMHMRDGRVGNPQPADV